MKKKKDFEKFPNLKKRRKRKLLVEGVQLSSSMEFESLFEKEIKRVKDENLRIKFEMESQQKLFGEQNERKEAELHQLRDKLKNYDKLFKQNRILKRKLEGMKRRNTKIKRVTREVQKKVSKKITKNEIRLHTNYNEIKKLNKTINHNVSTMNIQNSPEETSGKKNCFASPSADGKEERIERLEEMLHKKQRVIKDLKRAIKETIQSGYSQLLGEINSYKSVSDDAQKKVEEFQKLKGELDKMRKVLSSNHTFAKTLQMEVVKGHQNNLKLERLVEEKNRDIKRKEIEIDVLRSKLNSKQKKK